MIILGVLRMLGGVRKLSELVEGSDYTWEKCRGCGGLFAKMWYEPKRTLCPWCALRKDITKDPVH